MKALVVGFPKSGTSTLQKAFESSGWRAAHWRATRKGPYVGVSMYEHLYAGEDPFLEFRNYDAITEANYVSYDTSLWPQLDPIMLNAIRYHHPNCYFILNYRDPEEIADSICRWRDLQRRLDAMGAPGLPPGYARNNRNLVFWIKHHHDLIRCKYRKDKRFIEYEISDPDAPSRLQSKLGIKFSWWGVANKNKITPSNI